MNAKVKKLWVKALRSGKYEQGEGRLRPDESFCCLGVLCDLHRQAFHKQWKRDEVGYLEYAGEVYILPAVVREWAGLEEGDPRLGGMGAAEINDDGTSFEAIANRIEKYL